VLLPLTRALPPEEAAYQSITAPDGGVARSATVPVPQREAAGTTVGLAGTAFTVAVTATREAEMQPVELLRAWA
jgi:hypothetical protein